MKRLVAVYDIPDDRRRLKLFKTLEGYGIPVQFSVFECELSEEDFLIMKDKVERIIDKGEDSVVYYEICPRCWNRTERVGIRKRVMPDDVIVV
ncbi:MAG TPA: CRISPR-associated endonuclease Cas2 [Thermodesulfobacteriota bacterium]|jgi:CRISPR-associated protein Cas2|nr:CRISPR-associated endonuclease Cas2 [Thermodesulfobacteriota bacterium]